MKKVVADSSFYMCFLDDIKKPEYLVRIISYFEFVLGKIINEEIRRSNNYRSIEEMMNKNAFYFEYEDYGEILKPFFSIEEIKKGEHEVIAISLILVRIESEKIVIIIDDKSARNFIQYNFKDIYPFLKFSVKFIVECYEEYHIFNKTEIIKILKLIKNSKFRIKKEIIDNIINSLTEEVPK